MQSSWATRAWPQLRSTTTIVWLDLRWGSGALFRFPPNHRGPSMAQFVREKWRRRSDSNRCIEVLQCPVWRPLRSAGNRFTHEPTVCSTTLAGVVRPYCYRRCYRHRTRNPMPGIWPTIEQRILEAIALEHLGEGRRALGIATGWLRGKMAAGPDRADPSGESL